MDRALGFLGGIKVYLAVAVIALACGFGGGLKWQAGAVEKMKRETAEAQLATTNAALTQAYKQGAITAELGLKAAERQVVIQTRTVETLKEVPRYVTREADARCPLPVGAVRLHDAAAAGIAPDAVSFAAGQPNDAPSGVALSRLLSGVTANYGTCHQVRQQLVDLQGWVRAQQAASPVP